MHKRVYLPLLTLLSLILLGGTFLSLNSAFNRSINAALVAGAVLPSGVSPDDCATPTVAPTTCISPRPAAATIPWSKVILSGLATAFFLDMFIIDVRALVKAQKRGTAKSKLDYSKQHSLSRL